MKSAIDSLVIRISLLAFLCCAGAATAHALPFCGSQCVTSMVCGDCNWDYAVEEWEVGEFLGHCCIVPTGLCVEWAIQQLSNLCECPDPDTLPTFCRYYIPGTGATYHPRVPSQMR